MQRVVKALDEFRNSGCGDAGIEALQTACEKWAGYALHMFKDKLLRDALEISISIAAFLMEMEGKDDDDTK